MTNYSKLISNHLVRYIELDKYRARLESEIAVRQILEWKATTPEGKEDFKDYTEEPSVSFSRFTISDLHLVVKGIKSERKELEEKITKLMEGAVRLGQPTIHLNIPQSVLNELAE